MTGSLGKPGEVAGARQPQRQVILLIYSLKEGGRE